MQHALHGTLKLCFQASLLFITFFFAASISFFITQETVLLTAVWLPNAFIVAWLVLKPKRLWPWFLLATAISNICFNQLQHFEWHITLIFMVANLAEILTAAYLIRWFKIQKRFKSNLNAALLLLLICTLLAPAVNASIKTLFIDVATGLASFQWLKWFSRDSLGLTLLVPLLLSASKHHVWNFIKKWRENILFSILAILLTTHALLYLPFPFIYISLPLLFVAMRTNLFTTMLIVTITSTTIFVVVLAGAFELHIPPHMQNLPMVQLPVIMEMIPAFLIAVIMRSTRDKQRKLVLSEGFFRNAMEFSSIGMALVSMEGRWLKVNEAICSIVGYTKKELLQLTFQDITHPADLEADLSLLRKLISNDLKNYQIDKRYIRKNGEIIWIRLDVSLVRDINGQPQYFVSQIQNIDESLRDQQALKHQAAELSSLATRLHEERDRLQTILDCSRLSIIVTDTAGVITIFNRAAQNMLGYSEQEAVGKMRSLDLHLPEEVAAHARKLSAQLNRHIDPGYQAFIAKLDVANEDLDEWSYVRKDGSTFPVLLSITALHGINNEIVGYMGIAQDMSEQKKLDTLKKDFISTVSHELRTPLTSIRGSLGLVLSEQFSTQLNDKTRALLEIAHKNCKRLILLINDILDIEKIESGQMRFNLEFLKVEEVLQQAIELNQSYAEQYKVNIKIIEPVPNCEIYADSDRVMQVMSNLISNAAKFSPSGANVEISAAPTENHMIKIMIRDYGSGIPEDFKTKIFSKFSQHDSSSTKQKGGTGLGLNISRAIIEKLGGQIGFESKPNEGSLFYFDLPMVIENDVEKINPAVPHILIIENDQDNAKILQATLQSEKFDADIVENIHHAEKQIAIKHYTAITLDLGVLGLAGLNFIQRLRENSSTQNIPLIVVSAKRQQDHAELQGHAFEIVDWLTKPLDINRLIQIIKNAVATVEMPVILHVEDDKDVTEVITYGLKGAARVLHAYTLSQAEYFLQHEKIDLILLDIMLPDGSGLSVLDYLGPDKAIPVIIFSASEVTSSIQKRVQAALVKSRGSENTVIDTIKTLLRKLKSKS